MPRTWTTYAGSWPDLGILADGRIVLTYLARKAETPALTCLIDGAIVWRVPLTEGGLYQRLALSSTGRVLCAWQGAQSGLLTVVIDGKAPKQLGPTRGQNVAGCYWQGDQAVVLVQRSSTRLERVAVPEGRVLETITIPSTSQGLRDVLSDGTYVLGDAAMRTTRYGWLLSQPTTRGPWTAGQTDPPAIRLARADREYVTTAIQGEAYEPHVAVWGDTVAVCARGPLGVTLAVLTPPYPAHEPFVATPPPVPPPPVPPAPTPTPTPPVPTPRPTMPIPTDAEQIAFSEQLEATYKEDNRQKRETHIDVLGQARWFGDFRTDAMTLGAAAASRKIIAEVRRIMELPPLPPQ